MARIAFLVDNHFEQIELTGTRQRLIAQGHDTVLISTEHTTVQGWNHLDKADLFEVEQMLKDTHAQDFDALVLAGGVINADNLRINSDAQQLVREFWHAEKPIAAICHAPWLLISSGIVRGHTLTAYHTLQDDIQNAGARFLDLAVCVDHQLITSRFPDDIAAFSAAIHAALDGKLQLNHALAI